MKFQIINLETVDIDTITEVLDHNKMVYSIVEKDVEKLKKARQNKRNKIISSTNTNFHHPSGKMQKKEETLEVEMKHYINNFTNTTIEDLNKKKNILPSKIDPNYENIILRLRLETIKNLNEIKELISAPDCTLEELKYYQEELQKEFKKLDYLSNITTEENQHQQEKICNTLIFAATTGGNIRVLEEIEKDIPQEYYGSFKDLFTSIKDGTFRNVKRFSSNNTETAGFCEVKNHKTRVVFDRVGPNTYALITAFMKKSDNSKGYLELLSKKIKDYKDQKDSLLANLENPEFLQLNRQLEQELFQKLSPEDNIVMERGKKK